MALRKKMAVLRPCTVPASAPSPYLAVLFLTVLAIGAAILTLPNVVFAGVNQWTGNGPYGATVLGSIAVSPNYVSDHTVFAATHSGGLIKSVDGGASWTRVNSGLGWVHPFAVAVSPAYATDQTVFVGGDTGVFKSTNGGASWSAASTGLTNTQVRAVALSPNYSTDRTLFAGTWGGGLFKSTNGGASWSLVGLANAPVLAVALSPGYASDQTIFAGQWGGGLFKSTNGGATWLQCRSNQYVTSIGLSPGYSGDQTVLVVTAGSVIKSTSGGASWSAVNTGLPSGFSVKTIGLSPGYTSDGTAFAATYFNGVFKSVDRGASWSPVSAGLTDTRVLSTIGLSPAYASDQTLFVGTFTDGIFKSSTGGIGWTLLTAGLALTDVRAVAASPAYASDRTIFAGAYAVGFFKSTDSGASWSRLITGSTNSNARSVAVSPNYASDQTVFAGTTTALLKSTDRGANWSDSGTGLSTPFVRRIAFSPAYAGDQTLFIATRQGIFKSVNRGASWSAANTGLTSTDAREVDVSPGYASDQTLFAATSDGIFKSVNRGASWSGVNNGLTAPSCSSVAVSPVHASDQTLFAGTEGGGVFRSTNGGTSWSPVNTGLTNHIVYSITLSPAYASDDTIYAGTHGGGVFQSRDGGATWDEIETGLTTAFVNSIIVSPDYSSDHTAFAGLWGGGVLSYRYTETTPPVTTPSTTPLVPDGENGWFRTTPSIALTRNEAGITNCQWDATATPGWTTYSGPVGGPEGSHTLYFFSVDSLGNTETIQARLLKVDTAVPTDPTLSSPSHTVGVWSSDNTVEISMTAAGEAASGIDGFSVSWSRDETESPDSAKDLEETAEITTSPPLIDGLWYFNARTKDNAGNWTSTVHMGPFSIDTSPMAISSLTSTSHPDEDAWYSDNDPAFSWSTEDSAGVTGYSFVLDQVSDTTPDATSEGTVTTTVCTDTADGVCYFHVRVKDEADNWGPAAHRRVRIDVTDPTDPILTSPSHATGVWSSDNTIEVSITAAADANSGVDGFSVSWSQDQTAVPDATKDLEETADATTSASLDDGVWYFNARTADNAGNWTATVHLGPFKIDVSPLVISSLSSSTHPDEDEWYSNNDPEFSWSENDLSGVAGYSYALDQTADTTPDVTPESTATSMTCTDTADGVWYFHIRAKDGAGNWGSAAHRRARVDVAEPDDPVLSSPSHTVGAWSNDNTIDIALAGATDGASGLDGYSVSWSRDSTESPDDTKDLEEAAEATTSATLADGEWYFNVRTRDNAGNWTSTGHIGPFHIDTVAPGLSSLSSSSHPDEDIWYENNDPAFAWSAEDSSGVSGYSRDLNQTPDTLPDSASEGTATAITCTDTADGAWYLHVRARDGAGNWGAVSHRRVRIDTAAPNDPTVYSSSHVQGGWSNLKPIAAQISGASDTGSGVDGYSISWSEDGTETPDATKDLEEGINLTNSPLVADGSWYFNLRTRDNFGHWTGTAHAGPFRIDSVNPTDPVVASTSHTPGGSWSTTNTVVISISGAVDDSSGVDGYSVSWSQNSTATPNTTKDLEETADGASAAPGDGTWYFNLRTKDNAGNWTSTVHAGPFNIDAEGPSITSLSSSTHPDENGAYANNDPAFAWTGSDVSAVEAYSYGFDAAPATAPDESPEGTATTKSYTDVADGTWYFHVRGKDSTGNWGETRHRAITIDTAPPSAVSDLTTVAASGSSVDLRWTAPGDGFMGSAATYDIRYATVPINDGNWAIATQAVGEPAPGGAGQVQSFTVRNLGGGQTYCFAMKSADRVPNWSVLSNGASADTVSDDTPPGVPSPVSIYPQSANAVVVRWDPSEDDAIPGEHDVWYRVYDASTNALIDTTSLVRYAHGGRAPSTTHSYYVTAVDAVGNESGPSVTVSATTYGPGATPAGSHVEVDLGNGVTIVFGSVSQPGTTTIFARPDRPYARPAGYRLTGFDLDINTTAAYGPPVLVTIPYDPRLTANGSNTRLLHRLGGVWEDNTVGVDTVGHVVTGTSQTLSPFEPAELEPAAAPIPDASEWAMIILAFGGAGILAWKGLRGRSGSAGGQKD